MILIVFDGVDDDIVDVYVFKIFCGVVCVCMWCLKFFLEDILIVECDEIGCVVWCVFLVFCVYLVSDEGYLIVVECLCVFEFGVGLGMFGMLCWLSGVARETTLTDGNVDVVSDLW